MARFRLFKQTKRSKYHGRVKLGIGVLRDKASGKTHTFSRNAVARRARGVLSRARKAGAYNTPAKKQHRRRR